MPTALSRARGSAGFTLVELLVVLTLLSVLGAIITASMSRGLQADAQARSRLEAFEDMQLAMERMSREVRAARSVDDDEPLLGIGRDNGDPLYDELEIRVSREDDLCLRFTYKLENETTLFVTEDRSTDGCDGSFDDEGSPQVMLRDVDLDAIRDSSDDVQGIFTYRDASGDPIVDDLDDEDIASVEITLGRTLVHDQRPVTVSTVVGLRNR